MKQGVASVSLVAQELGALALAALQSVDLGVLDTVPVCLTDLVVVSVVL